jgi:hypothetical protein
VHTTCSIYDTTTRVQLHNRQYGNCREVIRHGDGEVCGRDRGEEAREDKSTMWRGERQLTVVDFVSSLRKVQVVEVSALAALFGLEIASRDCLGSGRQTALDALRGQTRVPCAASCCTTTPVTPACQGPAAEMPTNNCVVGDHQGRDCDLLHTGKHRVRPASAAITTEQWGTHKQQRYSREQESEQAEERRLLTCQDRIGALLLDVQVHRACCPCRWQRRP